MNEFIEFLQTKAKDHKIGKVKDRQSNDITSFYVRNASDEDVEKYGHFDGKKMIISGKFFFISIHKAGTKYQKYGVVKYTTNNSISLNRSKFQDQSNIENPIKDKPIKSIFDQKFIKTAIGKKINSIILKSKYPFSVSKKNDDVIVIVGDLVSSFIAEKDILNLIDNGKLNLWLSEFNNKIYTMIQYQNVSRPTYRNFENKNTGEKFSIKKLRELSKLTCNDEKDKSLYPWKYKYNYKIFDNYYLTKDWRRVKDNFYRLKYPRNRSCSCCLNSFGNNELSLRDLHHMVTIKNGGSNSTSNLVMLCMACHSIVHKSKSMLIESLFIFYAYTGEIGNTKIRNVLNEYDDKKSFYDKKLLLGAYDEFVDIADQKQIKLYFFKNIEKSFRYNNNQALFQYSDWYFKCGTHEDDSSYWDRDDELICTGEIFYDILVLIFHLYSLTSKKIYYFKKKKESIKFVEKDIQSITNKLEQLIYKENSFEWVIIEILILIRTNRKLQQCYFFSYDAFSFPHSKITDSDKKLDQYKFYENALSKRNRCFYFFASTFGGYCPKDIVYKPNNLDKNYIKIIEQIRRSSLTFNANMIEKEYLSDTSEIIRLKEEGIEL